METSDIPETETASSAASEATRIVRENPIPVVIGALVTGVILGLLARGFERPPTRLEQLRDRLEGTEGYLRDLLESVAGATKKGYKKSAKAVKDTVDRALEKANDLEDDYVEPAKSWLKRLFS